jgi:hypothetical protein
MARSKALKLQGGISQRSEMLELHDVIWRRRISVSVERHVAAALNAFCPESCVLRLIITVKRKEGRKEGRRRSKADGGTAPRVGRRD